MSNAVFEAMNRATLTSHNPVAMAASERLDRRRTTNRAMMIGTSRTSSISITSVVADQGHHRVILEQLEPLQHAALGQAPDDEGHDLEWDQDGGQ